MAVEARALHISTLLLRGSAVDADVALRGLTSAALETVRLHSAPDFHRECWDPAWVLKRVWCGRMLWSLDFWLRCYMHSLATAMESPSSPRVRRITNRTHEHLFKGISLLALTRATLTLHSHETARNLCQETMQ